MKRIVQCIVCSAVLWWAVPTTATAGTPEKVYSITVIQMELEWYKEQMELWRKEVEANPTNGEAWLNYFKAGRYARNGDPTLLPKERYELQAELVEAMGKAIPNSFEYHYAMWWNGGNRAELFSHLEKAYQARQDDAELSDDFISYYELQGNTEQVKNFCQKWYATRDIAPGLLLYHYNVLMSLEKNALLVTSGDNDTYPVWMLQYAKGVRPDVTVLNTGLLGAEGYRAALLKKHDIRGNMSVFDKVATEQLPWHDAMAQFLQSIAESNTKRPLYFALTAYPKYTELVKHNLYTVGLVNLYSAKRIDNIALLKKNWQHFDMGYLEFLVYNEGYLFNKQLLPRLNMNYVTPALLLYEHYTLAGEKEKAESLKEFALKIAREGGQEKDVKEYIASLFDKQLNTTTDVPKAEEQAALWAEKVTVYPNPVFNVLTVELPPAMQGTIDIVDINGSVVESVKTSSEVATINIGNLAAGAYVVRIVTPQGTTSKTVHVVR